MQSKAYDIAIIGGGLAGLALSIQLAEKGWSVAVFEKQTYPFHRVCGEYISMEAWAFLCSLSVPLPQWDLPFIRRLQVTAPNGRILEADLPLGGFGVSRYKLDGAMANIARQKGVCLYEGAKVEQVMRNEKGFVLQVRSPSGRTNHQAMVCCGAWGKRSNLDVKWQRPFVADPDTRISNWVGIKYHVRTQWPADLIGLHNFRDGYCGISRVEDGLYCLCYLTRAANLRGAGQQVPVQETSVLARNPVLRHILNTSERQPGFPLAISQVSFRPKTQVENGVLMVGDAAGMITPLCGNGMSMALHASKIAAEQIDSFLAGKQGRAALEAGFQKAWHQQFGSRLRTGRMLQQFFGSGWGSSMLVSVMRRFPQLTSTLIKKTHGVPF